MAITSDILDAFCAHVGAIAQAQSLPVAYPAIAFTPPTTGGWLEVAAHWNGNEPYALANDGASIEQGFFRVLVCWRLGASPLRAQDAAEAVVTATPKGSTFAKARAERAASIGGLLIEQDRLIIPVTVRWRATR